MAHDSRLTHWTPFSLAAAMSAGALDSGQDDHLPELLLLRPPATSFEAALSHRFRLLKPYESPLPRPLFLAAHANSVTAMFISDFARVDAEILAILPNLRCIVTTSAGFDHIDMSECARKGVAVAGAGGVFSEDVADCAVGLLIDVLRRMSASDRYVRRGEWLANGDYPLGSKMSGKRVGIIGLGSIGSEIAKRLEAFGCIILYTSRAKKTSVPYQYLSTILDLAAESQVLIATCALTRETYHIIDSHVMAALGKDGILINMGRGALINEKELVRCLVQGEIGGAGLDVYENEPEVPKELFLLDNVVLSPHTSARTSESYSGLLSLMIANLEAFFSNRPLPTPILD